ncbi:MAG TPA: DUF2752 domain-containing protein [Bacteroidales bacterium]|mgnify:CR=1 FL=1|nr:DUF2752 domain-containing protein [Bacteroidales bacterium]
MFWIKVRALLMPWSEVMIWLTAMLLLAFVPPEQSQQTLCVWHHLGIGHCPGCGLGHSIADLFKGRIASSFLKHPMGIFAVVVIVWRIFRLTTQNLRIIKTINQKPYVKNL